MASTFGRSFSIFFPWFSLLLPARVPTVPLCPCPPPSVHSTPPPSPSGPPSSPFAPPRPWLCQKNGSHRPIHHSHHPPLLSHIPRKPCFTSVCAPPSTIQPTTVTVNTVEEEGKELFGHSPRYIVGRAVKGVEPRPPPHLFFSKKEKKKNSLSCDWDRLCLTVLWGPPWVHFGPKLWGFEYLHRPYLAIRLVLI